MTVPARTAEWICTNCGSTNRKLVPFGVESIEDRCVSCGKKHDVRLNPRPVRWDATEAR